MSSSLLLSLLLTVALSIHSVLGLNCVKCSDPNDSSCASTASFTCASGETQCVSAIIKTTSDLTSQRIVKDCAASSLCPASTTQDFSLNVGGVKVLAKAVCCNSNLCNSADAPAPLTPGAGTLQCYSCDPLTGGCSVALACNALENNCFSSRVIPSGSTTASATHGCTSGNVCAAAAALSSSPLFVNVGAVQGTPTCCSSNYCNPLPATTARPTTTTTTTTTTTKAPTSTTTTKAPTASSSTAGASWLASLLLLQVLALVLTLSS